MWTVSYSHMTWVVGASIVPDTNDKFKSKPTDTFHECSGFKAAVSEDTYPKVLLDEVRHFLQHVERQGHWRSRVFALVDAVRDRKLGAAIVREQHHQMDAMLAVVGAYERQLNAYFLHSSEVNTQAEKGATFASSKFKENLPLGLIESCPAGIGIPRIDVVKAAHCAGTDPFSLAETLFPLWGVKEGQRSLQASLLIRSGWNLQNLPCENTGALP